ncbi:ras-related protein ced-10-like [Onthophagus taurus]|uniref:ras-related protein ced-10-like n=1 Tax=Onthophagus taurus TaxID=166361 RepID=UPI000C1FDB71|nr:ras-related protein ced-10-like [Onthophagus taurus]
MNKNIKITIVGDGSVGKTCLLICYTTKKPCMLEYIPTVFDNYDQDYILDGNEYKISLWDTAGQEGYDRLRVFSYPNTDCFVLCYAINGLASLVNIKEIWVPELKRHRPFTPIVLVATKCDLRNVDDPNLRLISTEKGLQLAKDIKAVQYLECSAHDMIGVEQVIECAVRATLKPLPTSKKRRCLIL